MGHGFRGLDVWFSASGSGVVGSNFRCPGFIVNPRKLEHGFRRISAMIPYTLPEGHEDTHVPIFPESTISYSWNLRSRLIRGLQEEESLELSHSMVLWKSNIRAFIIRIDSWGAHPTVSCIRHYHGDSSF